MHKTLPHNDSAEQAVLGSVLLETSVIHICRQSGITVNSFYNNRHKAIFKAILELCKLGIAVDCTTIESRLKQLGCEEAYANRYLDVLVDKTPTSTHAQHYIEIVRNEEMLRDTIYAASEMQAEATEHKNPRSILSSSVVRISEILNTSKRSRDPESFHKEHIERRERAKNQGVIGYKIAMPDIMGSIINSWNPPDNIVIGAKSSSGKTMLMIAELLNQAMNGIPVGIVSTDMTEFALRQRMAAYIADINAFKFGKPYWSELDASRIDAAYETLNKLPVFINDDSESTCDDVCSWATAMVAKYGIKFLGVDFIQQLSRTKQESREDMRIVVGERSRRIKSVGKRFDMVTMVLSQLARYGEKASDKTPPVPNKESLKETGDLEQNADIVGLLSFAPDRPKVEFTYVNPIWDLVLNIDKQRDGPTGMIDLCLKPSTGRFMSRIDGTLRREEYEEEERRRILEETAKK
jgi:replicative DNA helicase